MGDVSERGYAPTNKPSDTLVIHCVDHRFQEALRGFITNELGIAVFNPMTIAGGAFAVSSEHFSYYSYIRDQIDYFVTEGGAKQVVLINHEDCSWYKRENSDLEVSELKEKGKTDLSQAARNIKDKYPDIEVISIWADLSKDMIRFYKID